MVSTDKVVTGMERGRTRPIAIVVSILVAVLGISVVTFAAAHVRGVVTGRAADGALILRTAASPPVPSPQPPVPSLRAFLLGFGLWDLGFEICSAPRRHAQHVVTHEQA